MVAAAVTPSPHATLLTFSRYVDRTGPGKAAFVGGLRRARQSRSGFNPHGQFVKALKADIRFRNRGPALAIDAVVETVAPRWRPLYTTLRAGGRRYLESLGDPAPQLTQVHDALTLIGGLTVRVNPHFGLASEQGPAAAVRLHFDEQPPSPELIVATLHLMTRQLDRVLPGGEAVLVDLRRGVTHRPDPRTRAAEVEAWLAGEAAAFTAMWNAAA